MLFITSCQPDTKNNNINSDVKTDSAKIDESNNIQEDIFPNNPFEGYFVKYEVGDYVHIIFQLLDSTEVSLWMSNDSTIEKALNNNMSSLFKVYYKTHTKFIWEAGDSVKIEIIESIEVME